VILKNSEGVIVGTTTVRQSGTNPVPESVNKTVSCVGAFWRHNETGERVVKIEVGANHGAWTAMVSFTDSKWKPLSGDGIVVAAGDSDDPKIGTPSPGNAESFTLHGEGFANSVSGYIEANGILTFRIGLEKTFDAFHKVDNPARYAVVELWYANHTKMQHIYLRQGEGDDYVMRPDAPDFRSAARKFSPYNLTAKTPNAQVAHNGIGNNPGLFVEYPSQIGAFFQWGNNGAYLRYAWDTHTQELSTLVSMTFAQSSWFMLPYPWNDNYETCPDGYRRPEDHATVANSEMRQSLWLHPPTGDANSRTNYIYGYYADGFYDRRTAVRLNGTSVGIVHYQQDDAAYGGGLFYNPVTKASLFLPVSASRGMVYGELSNSVGHTSYYWTRTQKDVMTGYALTQSNENGLVMGTPNLSQANSIRCIKKP
jgi:hypothetical protein